MTVREATAGDADGIGRVHAESWLVAYAGIFPSGFLSQAVEQRRGMWGQLLADPWMQETTLLVAEVDGRIAGFLHFGESEVFGLYVHPDAWGTGVAQRLMERFRPTGEAVLWTFPESAQARRFYEKCGWELTGAQTTRDFGDGVQRPQVQYRLRPFVRKRSR
jgi:GNAT superfamily N-acetyltransferase